MGALSQGELGHTNRERHGPGDVQLDQRDRHVGKVLGYTYRGLDESDHDQTSHAELQRLGCAGLPDRQQQSDHEPDEE